MVIVFGIDQVALALWRGVYGRGFVLPHQTCTEQNWRLAYCTMFHTVHDHTRNRLANYDLFEVYRRYLQGV